MTDKRQFATHVYTTVRVKVIGTNFSNDPQVISDKVTEAVCANPEEWMRPVNGIVEVEGHGGFDIEAVEFADGIYGVMVDEFDPESGRVIKEHHFDETGNPRVDAPNLNATLAEVIAVLEEHPDASSGNSKVHFALMRLKGLVPVQ